MPTLGNTENSVSGEAKLQATCKNNQMKIFISNMLILIYVVISSFPKPFVNVLFLNTHRAVLKIILGK